MSNEAKGHSPLPWKACELGVIAENITSHGNFYIATIIEPAKKEDKANAALIVRAVNSLDSSIAAMEAALKRLQLEANYETRFSQTMDTLRAAITLARGNA